MANIKKNVTRVSQVVTFTSIFFIILLAIYIFVGRPVLKYSESLKAEFGQKQAKLAESQELVRSLPNPIKAMEEIKVKLQEVQELGVSKKQIPRLMQFIGQAASDRNINVVSLRPREDFKSEDSELPVGINRIYLEIVLNCNYQEVAEYIKSVNELATAFKVESLTVEKESGTFPARREKQF